MALSLFVGRQRELQRYQEFLAREIPWVLIIRGLGGSGKSTFLSELEKQKLPDTCIVMLDFAQKTLREDYLKFLEEVSRQVAPYCEPERIVEFKQSIIDGRTIIASRAAGNNTTIGEINQGITAGTSTAIHDADLKIEVGEAQIQEARRQVRETAREKLYAQMRTFSLKRLVIRLDTCEWLNEETAEAEAARWAGTELMKGLRSRMQQQGKSCYVVMTSRVPLQLEGINETEIEQWKLKMLQREEVNLYLEDIEIQDPLIQDYIYNMTYGHPHSVAIVHDICEEHWDRPLSAADLPTLKGLFYERALQDVIDKDILKRLMKSPLDVLTRYGVVLRRFNLPLLQAVFQEWLPESEASNRFNQLVRYPHVEPLGDFNYVFHKLLREILAGYIQAQEPEKWRRYHRLALDFLAQNSAHSPDWYYHLLACDEEQGISYWNEVKANRPPEYIDTLRDAARDKTLKLTLAAMQCMNMQRDAAGNIA